MTQFLQTGRGRLCPEDSCDMGRNVPEIERWILWSINCKCILREDYLLDFIVVSGLQQRSVDTLVPFQTKATG